MKQLYTIIGLFFLFISFIISDITASTIFTLSGNGESFACVNRDGTSNDANIWFYPGMNGKYGTVSCGWNDGLIQSGMNEKGLFLGISITPSMKVNFSPDKLTLTNEMTRGQVQILEKILRDCNNVAEALVMIKKYNINEFTDHHLMLADRTGASAILEWQDSLIITEKDGNYMLFSNYLISNPGRGNYPCQFYDFAEKELDKNSAVGKKYCQEVLAVSVDIKKNIYSLIYDLKTLKVYLYYKGIFSKEVELNLMERLAKGTHTEKVTSLMQGGIPKFADLSNKDGKMHFLDQNTPYSGKCIDYYNDGVIKEERTFANGLEQGKRIKYFSTGQVETEETYVGGEKSGTWVSYRRTETIKENGEYINSRPSGTWSGFYANGNKEFEKIYEDGSLEGTWTGWFENGTKEYEKNYKKGKLEGLSVTYFEKGGKETTKTFVNGNENGLSTSYYSDGSTESLNNYKDGKLDGKVTKYHKNGQMEYEEYYVLGKQEGMRTSWYENGVKEYEVMFTAGLKTGKFISWHDNNQLRCEGLYTKGKKEGQWVWYYSNGKTEMSGLYDNGKEMGAWVGSHASGLPKFERFYNYGVPQGKWTTWYENGNKTFKGEYNESGERTGKWIYYQEDGLMIRQENYEEGSLAKIAYFKDGKPYTPIKGEKLEGFYLEGEPVH